MNNIFDFGFELHDPNRFCHCAQNDIFCDNCFFPQTFGNISPILFGDDQISFEPVANTADFRIVQTNDFSVTVKQPRKVKQPKIQKEYFLRSKIRLYTSLLGRKKPNDVLEDIMHVLRLLNFVLQSQDQRTYNTRLNIFRASLRRLCREYSVEVPQCFRQVDYEEDSD